MVKQEMSKGIYIAVLNQGHIRTELSYLMAELTHQNKFRIFLTYPAEKPIANNRNQIVKDFLKRKEYDYLMMVDSDIVPPMNIVDLATFDKDIISGVCFAFMDRAIVPLVLKELPPEKRIDNKPYTIADVDGTEGLVEVDAVGTGCVIIKREVLEALQDDQPFCNIYDQQGVKTLGLDLSFCKKAKDKGFKVWVHLDYLCSHWTPVDLKDIYKSLQDRREIKKMSVKSDTPKEYEKIH